MCYVWELFFPVLWLGNQTGPDRITDFRVLYVKTGPVVVRLVVVGVKFDH